MRLPGSSVRQETRAHCPGVMCRYLSLKAEENRQGAMGHGSPFPNMAALTETSCSRVLKSNDFPCKLKNWEKLVSSCQLLNKGICANRCTEALTICRYLMFNLALMESTPSHVLPNFKTSMPNKEH